ncbi:phosphoenolpyruvate--protein phosphotransferase [Prosthecomicrobium sp. N25]|uniref:phosphoenolpyruvate--protein phosphotransferase n=1 Tax=Prosthecomicrobium sp. N25 TaxID=3129254 RepID=UPI00307842E6
MGDPRPVVLRGRVAAPGYAAGWAVRLHDGGTEDRVPGTQAEEIEALRAAIAAAGLALAGLASTQDDEEAVAILEFQIALLEDYELTGPVFDAVAAGRPADRAWNDRLDAEIAGYRAAEDDYFRARSADLDDLRVRVLRHLAGARHDPTDLPADAVVVARDLPPSRFLEIPWRIGQGIVLAEGSHTGHAAILARARGIPMLVGVAVDRVPEGVEVLLDAEAGTVVVGPDSSARSRFASLRAHRTEEEREARTLALEPASTRTGEPVSILLNIAGPDDLNGLDPRLADGIGLVRTEFLAQGRTLATLPDEEAQFDAYSRILEWADGRPVTIRTLDAGGDKPIPGYTPDRETNPFLGLRGVRLSLAHPEVFRVQLRALLRAAALGPLQVMIPMVTVPAELDACRRLLEEEAQALDRAGVPRGQPRLGMMVEVPAAALALDLFDADFVSIGSNDLVQYLMAAGRDTAAVADLADPLAPAVLRLIRIVAEAADELEVPLSLCGDAGGDPTAIPALLEAGLRSFSMGAASVPRAKAAVRAWGGR